MAALAVLLLSCGKPKVYVAKYDDNLSLSSVRFARVVGDSFGVTGAQNIQNSALTIKISKINSSCTSEKARSLGSDFDGFVLIEVYKNGSLAAKAQSDFKTEPTKKDYERLWRELVVFCDANRPATVYK